jgi:hypothetical protein
MSGGKPAFPTLRLLNFLDCFTLKAAQGEITISTLVSSGVRKVGLPPLFLRFCKAGLGPSIVTAAKYLVQT